MYGGGNSDAFVAKLNPTGTALVYSTYLGGTGYELGYGIAVDAAGNAYVTGTTWSTDFPTAAGALQTTYGGGNGDAFVAKFAFATQTTTALTTSASPSTYGDTVTFTVAVTAQGSPVTSGAVDFKESDTVLASMVPLSASGTASFSISSLSAITHTITAFYSGASALGASSGSIQQVVNKKAASVTASSATKVYGAGLPPLTYTIAGFVNGDTASVVSGSPVLSTTATASSHVSGGPYLISISAGTLWAANYSFNLVGSGLSITPVPLTTTVNSATKVYGAALPTLSASYSGFVNGDSSASLVTAPTLTTTASTSSHVGSYAITASGAVSGDYAISYVFGSLSVTPAALTITADNKTKVYGSGLPALTASYAGWVNGDTSASLITLPSISTSATAASPVLPSGYAIIAYAASDPDYTISYQPGTLLIMPAPLTITANNFSMVQGTAVPRLSASYSGFVNGDSPASLGTLPTLSTPATPLGPPGSYAILAGGASSPNYVINYANGILVVTPAPVKVLKVSIQAIRLGKTKKTTQVIVVQFSGALTPGGARSTSSYSLTTIPANKRQKSQPVALSQAQYNATTNTVTLITRKPLVLNPPIRLTMNAARLLDSYGQPLSGKCVATLSKRRVAF
jgi:hypothetical protein